MSDQAKIAGVISGVIELIAEVDDLDEQARLLAQARTMIAKMKKAAKGNEGRERAADTLDNMLKEIISTVKDQAAANAELKKEKLDVIKGNLEALRGN